jgi:hypothetical protein
MSLSLHQESSLSESPNVPETSSNEDFCVIWKLPVSKSPCQWMDTDDDDDDDDDFDEDRMFLPAFLAAPMDTSTSSLISMKMGDACVIEDHLMSDSLVTLLLSATTKSAAQQ